MRILIIIMLFSSALWAKTSEEVVKDYTEFIQNPSSQNIEQLFSKKFIKNFGGKKKLNEVFAKASKKTKRKYEVKKIGSSKETEYVELSSEGHKTTYILKKEGSTYKIDGTMESD